MRGKREITYEYIRGLVEGEATFTFHTTPRSLVVDGKVEKMRVPAFVIRMHERDKPLITAVAEKLGISSDRVSIYGPYRADGHKRGKIVNLAVRDLGTLKNVIIPLFRNKLIGNKAKQFDEWVRIIGEDPRVPEQYKIIYRLSKEGGFYDRNISKFDKIVRD